MPQEKSLADQVRFNCDISDARHAGLFSICGLALRLRDLYKWEHDLAPWQERDTAEILDWIGAKEALWEKLVGRDYRTLSLNGERFDPFDTQGLNARLNPCGLFYGAGYARSMKPTFFLAGVRSQTAIHGYPVYTLGRELARDLLTLPALSQDQAILLREESAKLFLWDRMAYLAKSGRPALRFALERLGIADPQPDVLRQALPIILEAMRGIFLHHELGEMTETGFDGEIWREIIGAFARTPLELLARALKDLLADTAPRGALRHLVKERQSAGLGFYVAFLEGLTKKLLPELTACFGEFARTGDWGLIEQAVSAGQRQVQQYAREMAEIYLSRKDANDLAGTAAEMEARLLKRLLSLIWVFLRSRQH